MNGSERAARQVALKAIYRAYARDPAFNRLKAHDAPKHLVPGRGSMDPRAVFVGEAPGETESYRRKPFVGPAGRVLDNLLRMAGVDRADVFVTNVVKYRPTVGEVSIRNRTPDSREIAASTEYLRREIDVFSPGVLVVTLGTTPLRALYRMDSKVSMWHGRGWYDADRMYFSLYHPAYVMYDPTIKAVMERDMKEVVRLIREES